MSRSPVITLPRTVGSRTVGSVDPQGSTAALPFLYLQRRKRRRWKVKFKHHVNIIAKYVDDFEEENEILATRNPLFSLKVDESVKIQVYAVNITPPITNVSEILNALVAGGAKVGAILHQGMNLFVFFDSIGVQVDLVLRVADLEQEAIQYMNVALKKALLHMEFIGRHGFLTNMCTERPEQLSTLVKKVKYGPNNSKEMLLLPGYFALQGLVTEGCDASKRLSEAILRRTVTDQRQVTGIIQQHEADPNVMPGLRATGTTGGYCAYPLLSLCIDNLTNSSVPSIWQPTAMLAIMRALIDNGADINAASHRDHTPIRVAIASCHRAAFGLLVSTHHT
ncbi:unnamed protein product [Vitrella brassicaformis CCMP3155]|uniref:Uncharacterized protein n=1 Tax=Vitrella brassicaformis (strain CCMP3155) TaxID=1169540 RepID=A0A0G4FM48_VITBC|nr:unnamed protein product [Vitrella brassicaformis CCMP3155]|eukprot:CEM14609.1 unnamed protein product [Vitrella brassicaformis CCMP3155]